MDTLEWALEPLELAKASRKTASVSPHGVHMLQVSPCENKLCLLLVGKLSPAQSYPQGIGQSSLQDPC